MDETDNHVQSFWSDVLGALAVVDIVPADSALRHMTPAAGFGARELTQIREALAELPEVLVLVLDDFQQVSNPAVLESFGQLLDHQPPQLRLVLATRSDPALRLHRLRVNGEVTDVRAHDLAFGSTEAAELFARNGLRLSEGQLTVLLDRTQGWAAGLRLALMCLDPGDIDGGISRFTGSDHLVAEYLIEEVTDQLPEQDREFLLMTSVADRLAAGLANELTGRSDGQLSLERLASRNSLVVDLAGRSEWFSVHPMLRELLLHRLSRDRPGIVADVHLRASRWFAQQGEPIPAIRHAGRALDWDEVGRPLAALGLPLVLTPSGPALVAALGPAAAHALVAPTTSTLLAAALCHYHRHDFEAMAHNARDAAALMVDVRPNDRPAAAVTIALLDVVYARTRNPAATTGRASTLLALLDQVPRWQMPVIEHYRVVATNNIALGRLWAGDLAAAETNLASVQTRCAEMGLGLVELSALAHLALLDAIHGRFPDAAGRADAGQRIAERRGWSSEPQALALYAALALTDIATNRLDAAQASIDARPECQQWRLGHRLPLGAGHRRRGGRSRPPRPVRCARCGRMPHVDPGPRRGSARDAGPLVRRHARRHAPVRRPGPGGDRPVGRREPRIGGGSLPPSTASRWPRPDCCCINPTPRSTCWPTTQRHYCRTGEPQWRAGSWPPSRPTERTARPLPCQQLPTRSTSHRASA